MILFAQWKFYLRNGDSFYAMEILFAQWVIYCTRKQKFFLRNDKASNLNHIHFAQWVKILCLWCLKSLPVLHHIIHCIHIFAFPIMKGFDMILKCYFVSKLLMYSLVWGLFNAVYISLVTHITFMYFHYSLNYES